LKVGVFFAEASQNQGGFSKKILDGGEGNPAYLSGYRWLDKEGGEDDSAKTPP
jgi:hypothetical protein